MGDGAADLSYEPSAHYDRVTDAWTFLLGEELHYGVFPEGTEDLPTATVNLTDLMLDEARLSPGAEVLDVGCGTGAPACELARRSGVRVTGITTSATGVEAARARAAAEALTYTVGFERRDGMDNGFVAESFDCTWVLESSHLMRDRRRLLAECSRVLRPGGRLVLCDIMLGRPMDFQEVKRLRHPLALLRGVFGDARMEQPAYYADAVADLGLAVTAQTDLTRLTRPTFARWRENGRRHRDEVVARIGADGLSEFLSACDVLEGFWDDGTLGYGLLSAQKHGRSTPENA